MRGPQWVTGGCQLDRGETTTTGICPAISGATQYSPCFECSRLVDLSLLNLAHSSQLFERAHARVANLCLACEGDGRSISRSQVGQWRQDDKAPEDQILVFEWRALLGGKIERPNFGLLTD